MTLADLDRVIAQLALAAGEVWPTTVGDMPVVIVDVPGDALRAALAVLRSMRDSAIEGWCDTNWMAEAGRKNVWVWKTVHEPGDTRVLLIPGDAP